MPHMINYGAQMDWKWLRRGLDRSESEVGRKWVGSGSEVDWKCSSFVHLFIYPSGKGSVEVQKFQGL